MKKPITLVSPILAILTIILTQTTLAATKTLLIGSMQFPRSLTTIDPVNIRCAGNNIECQIDHKKNELSFVIPKDKRDTQLYLVIAERIEFEVVEGNTIAYQKIDPTNPYKFYKLTLVKVDLTDPEEIIQAKKIKQDLFRYEWLIEELQVSSANGRIPDDAVVIRFKADYVKNIEGGSKVALPKIIIKEDIMQLAGSEADLHDTSITLLLSSVDTKSLHTNIQQEVKQDYQHRRVTIVA